jgi:tetratricopeptide (TPR) repeat protein
MNMASMTHRSRLCLVLPVSLLLIAFTQPGCGKGVSRYDNARAGRDPHQAFKTAQEMYRQAKTTPFDKDARHLMTKVDQNLALKRLPEQETHWRRLSALNPYRRSQEVQQALSGWVDRILVLVQERTRANGQLPAKEKEALYARVGRLVKDANQRYAAKKFEAAEQAYCQALLLDPTHLDARNNLALTLMVRQRDLPAQLELGILQKLKPTYVPAAINLTVLHERGSNRDAARRMAEQAYELSPDLPMAAFNLAWLKDLDGDHTGARKLTGKLARMHVTDKPMGKNTARPGTVITKYQRYHQHVTALAEKRRPYWQKGLVASLDLKDRSWFGVNPVLVVSVVFLLITFVMIRTLGRRVSPAKGFWMALFAGLLVYSLFWGPPVGWEWVRASIYLLVAGFWVMGIASS